jgi:hypothetical protein
MRTKSRIGCGNPGNRVHFFRIAQTYAAIEAFL